MSDPRLSAVPAADLPAADAGVHRPAEPLRLRHGGTLEAWEVGYELVGDAGLPVVVVLGGISAGRHLTAHAADDRPGWWQDVVGPGRAIDTTRVAALGVDWLGGRGASTLPPEDVAIDTHDQARAIAAVLDRLGVARARAVVGSSYGGMVALAFAALFPERLDRAVVVGAAHESAAMSTGIRSIQRRIVRLGVETGRERDALAIARALGMTTYRSAVEFNERFAGPGQVTGGKARFPIESYLEHQGKRFAESFPVRGFLELSQSCDLHRVDPAALRVPTTLVAVEEDTLVPPSQMRTLAAALGELAEFVLVHSVYGHDAFLTDPVVADAVRAALERMESGRAALG
jgi:homoserine O-acetyltransferase